MKGTGHLLVSVDRKFDDIAFKYKDQNGVEQFFYKSVLENLHWDVTVTGRAESDFKPMGISVGDEVIFSYQVISEKVWNDAPQIFQKTVDAPGVFTEWTDGEGAIIKKVHSPIRGIWDAFALDNKGKLLGREHGTESKCEKFLSQFNFSNLDGRFVNLFEVDGKDLWKVKKSLIIGVRREGGIELFNDQILLRPVYVDLTTRVELMEGIKLPERYVQAEYKNMGAVEYGGSGLGLEKGDIVVFESRFAQKYKFWGEDYYILAPDRIFGIFEQEKGSNLIVNA